MDEKGIGKRKRREKMMHHNSREEKKARLMEQIQNLTREMKKTRRAGTAEMVQKLLLHQEGLLQEAREELRVLEKNEQLGLRASSAFPLVFLAVMAAVLSSLLVYTFSGDSLTAAFTAADSVPGNISTISFHNKERQEIGDPDIIAREDGKYDVKVSYNVKVSSKKSLFKLLSTAPPTFMVEVQGLESPALEMLIDQYDGHFLAQGRIATPVISAAEAAFESATITLPKQGRVERIYRCPEFDITAFSCPFWEATSIPFIDNGESITFTVEHFSAYAGGEIIAIDAEHLAADYSFISNIYPEIKARDNLWSEAINDGEYARVTYEHNLTDGRIIDVAASSEGTLASFEIYEAGTNHKVGESPLFTGESYEFIPVNGLTQPTDIFDFKIRGVMPTSFLKFDYIHDQPITPTQANGMVAYGPINNASPSFRIWNQSNNFSVAAFANGVGLNRTADLKWVVLRANHQRDEIILGTLGVDSDINIQIYNASSATWGALNEVTTGAAVSNTRPYDIAVEDLSGDVLIVWDTATTDKIINYEEWNGTRHSGSNTAVIPLAPKSIKKIFLTPLPGTDSIMALLVNSTQNPGVAAMLWNGTGWDPNTNQTLSFNTSTSVDSWGTEFAWEVQSREGLVAYGINGGNLSIQTFNATTAPYWSGEIINISFNTSTPLMEVVRFCSDLSSDYIGLIFKDSAGDARVRMWNGSQMLDNPPDRDDTVFGTLADSFALDCAWVNATSALFGFIDAGAGSADQNFSSFWFHKDNSWTTDDLRTVTQFNLTPLGIPGAGEVSSLQFFKHPTTEELMILFQQVSGVQSMVGALRWNGTSFQGVGESPLETLLETAASSEVGSYFTWNAYDPIPNVTALAPSGLTFQTSFAVPINATVVDNANISLVLVNMTSPNSSVTQFTLTDGNFDNIYTNTFSSTATAGTYTFLVIANDTSTHQNINSTESASFTISSAAELIVPNVTDILPTLNSVFNLYSFIEISANVTDETAVQKVLANVTLPNGSISQLTLSNATVGTAYVWKFNSSYEIPKALGVYNVTIIANDTSNNLNKTATSNFTAVDYLQPNVTGILPPADSFFNISEPIEISANVTDDIGISTVWANITQPNGSVNIVSLSNAVGTKYNFTFITQAPGKYNVTIIANDTSNNFNRTQMSNFTALLACGLVTTSANLTKNLTSTGGPCISIGANNIVLNGHGYYLLGRAAGGTVNNSDGINNSGGFDNITIRNFRIFNFTAGINATNMANSTIFNNTIETPNVSRTDGIKLASSGYTGYSHINDNNISFNNITIIGDDGNAIDIVDFSTATVYGNRITQNTFAGASVTDTIETSPGMRIIENHLTLEDGASRLLNGIDARANITIIGNVIFGEPYSRNAITANTNSKNVTIVHNTIHAGDSNTVILNGGSNWNITNNTISTLNGNGIDFGSDPSSDNSIVGNRINTSISGTTTNAITFTGNDGANNIIAHNVINSSGAAIEMNGVIASTTITFNNLTASHGSAQVIYLANANYSNISNNNITSFYSGSQDGITLNGSHNTITRNTITTTSSNSEGIQIMPGSNFNNISFNSIRVLGDGTVIYSIVHAISANNTLITSNDLFMDGNSGTGIILNDTSFTNISFNNITISLSSSSSLGPGIMIRRGDPEAAPNYGNKIQSNNFIITATRSAAIKILAPSASVTITGNTILTANDNTQGIEIYSSNSTIIKDNNFTINSTNSYAINLTLTSNNTIQDNIINLRQPSSSGILLDGVSFNNTFIANRIFGNISFAILDLTSDDQLNYFIENNTFGEIRWIDNGSRSFLRNLTFNITNIGGLGFNKSIFIYNNTLAFNISAFSTDAAQSVAKPRMNSTANITFFGMGLSGVNKLMRVQNFTTNASEITAAGTDCVGATCTNISYLNGILSFNTTGFSSFTGNFTPTSIPNTLPTAPAYLEIGYRNATAITNRTPIFIWQNSTDADGNELSYHLEVDDNALFNNPEINVSAIQNTIFNPANTTYFSEAGSVELSVDTTYYWRVRANDSTGYGSWSNGASADGPSEGQNNSNFTVNSLLSFTFTNGVVEFGTLERLENKTTVSGDPRPIRAENTGNIDMNVSINATKLFESVAFNSSFYQFKIRANESGAFASLSSTDWVNMSNRTDKAHVVNLTWRTIKNDFLTDLNISVPRDEAAGVKSSIITFTVTSNQ